MKTFIFIIAFTSICFSQIKIGKLTVSDKLAKEYFLDLYKYPDTLTISRDNCLDGYPGNNSFHDQYGNSYKTWGDVLKRTIKEYKEGSKYVLCGWKFFAPRKASEEDFIKWLNKR